MHVYRKRERGTNRVRGREGDDERNKESQSERGREGQRAREREPTSVTTALATAWRKSIKMASILIRNPCNSS